VMITNGGWGGVLAGLAAGVPLIIAGGDLDKPEIATRVAYSGAGIDLRTGRPSRAAIARAYGQLATEPRYRDAARRIADELARHDGAREVADRVEAVVAAGR
jgi:UDP:flavonoid glycosyltransferase YjiC (YdhE family)